MGLEPTTLSLGKDPEPRPADTQFSQMPAGRGSTSIGVVHESRRDGLSTSDSATRLLPTEGALTVREVAQLLSVNRYSIYKLCEAQRIVHFRIGNSIRIPREVVDALLRG